MKRDSFTARKFYPVLFVTLVTLATVSLLVLTDNFTRAEIQVQQDEQTLNTIREVFPDAGSYAFTEESGIYRIYDDGENGIGYAFYAEGMGEAVYGGETGTKVPGPIVIMVGLEDKERIKGIFVVSNSETPQIWNFLVKEDYFDQFIGLKIEETYFSRDGGQVDSVTGATLSSTLVLNTVREAALEKVELIR